MPIALIDQSTITTAAVFARKVGDTAEIQPNSVVSVNQDASNAFAAIATFDFNGLLDVGDWELWAKGGAVKNIENDTVPSDVLLHSISIVVAPTIALVSPNPTTINSAGTQQVMITVQYSAYSAASIKNENLELVAPDGQVYHASSLIDYDTEFGSDARLVAYTFEVDFQYASNGNWQARSSADNAATDDAGTPVAQTHLYYLPVNIPEPEPPYEAKVTVYFNPSDGSVSAAILADPAKVRRYGGDAMRIAYSPDPDSDNPGTDTGVATGDDIVKINREDIAPGDYVGIPSIHYTDGTFDEDDPFKFTITAYQVFLATRLIDPDEEVAVQAARFQSFRFDPHPSTPIQNLEVTLSKEFFNSSPQITPPRGGTFDSWYATFASGENPGDIQIATATLTFATRSETFRWFVRIPDPLPETSTVKGVSSGETVEWNREVSVTHGTADPDRTLTSIQYGVWRWNTDTQTLGDPLSVSSVASDSSAGIAGITWEVQDRGTFAIGSVYTYTDGEPNPVYDLTIFENPPLSQAPHNTSLLVIGADSIFVDSRLSLFVYSDHQHDVTKQSLIIESPTAATYEMNNVPGGRQVLLELADIGMNTAGTYTFKWRVELSDTVPAISESSSATVTVQHIPAETLLDSAIAAPTEDTNWQTVIDSPLATPNQKAIAQGMISLNAEINSGTLGSLQPEAENDRTRYLEELQEGTTTKTFGQWRQQQANIFDPLEQQEAKDFVADAPTSSVAALLAYFNSKKHPYQSLLRLMLGGIPEDGSGFGTDGDWQFIRNNAASYGGSVDDSVVLSDYARYQVAVQSMTEVIPFELWI